jgi:hypothetical protein
MHSCVANRVYAYKRVVKGTVAVKQWDLSICSKVWQQRNLDDVAVTGILSHDNHTGGSVLLEKLIVNQMINKQPYLREARKLITLFAKFRHWVLY